jgi:hypothetical protein
MIGALATPERHRLTQITPRLAGRWPALTILLLIIACTFKPVVENDGIGYFAYLHWVVVSSDRQLADEYQDATEAGSSPVGPTNLSDHPVASVADDVHPD